MVELELPGVILIERDVFSDIRGAFSEVLNPSLKNEIGDVNFVQGNVSYSRKSVIRGMHWQDPPFAQGKLLTCFNGSILDVVLCIDERSVHFGKLVSVILSSEEGNSIWIPEGYAHGFESLENNSIVHYLVTRVRDSSSERRINPLSPPLKAIWRTKNPIVSDSDLKGKLFL